jgi:hypothetical protein
MILGDLDLDWAEQDPDYLARVKAFLQSTAKSDISIPGHPFPLARISHTGHGLRRSGSADPQGEGLKA